MIIEELAKAKVGVAIGAELGKGLLVVGLINSEGPNGMRGFKGVLFDGDGMTAEKRKEKLEALVSVANYPEKADKPEKKTPKKK